MKWEPISYLKAARYIENNPAMVVALGDDAVSRVLLVTSNGFKAMEALRQYDGSGWAEGWFLGKKQYEFELRNDGTRRRLYFRKEGA